MPKRPVPKTLEQRFWSRVEKRGPQECWPWTGHRDRHGYGKLSIEGQTFIATRLMFFATHGRFPKNFCCHHCDNPNCVNPVHLYDGTQAENNRDTAVRGRHKARRAAGKGE